MPRRARRASTGTILGGVASGVARHLGVPDTWLRLGFLLATVFGGVGVVLYAVLWIVMPSEERFAIAAPGTEAATRQGRRPGQEAAPLSDSGFLIAAGTVGVGVALLFGQLTGNSTVIWPLSMLAVSAAVLWRQADAAQRERWLDTSGRIGPMRVLVGSGGWASYARLLVGFSFLVAAVVMFAVRGGQLTLAREVAVATILAVAGVAFMLGPWLFRLSSDLTAERAERIRVQERADVAAHLHDSVLQTLALIQRSAHDPTAVSTLARAQERDLRTWLYSTSPTTMSSLESGLRLAAAEVEDTFGVPVSVVSVGSSAYNEALVSAAKEAMVNAAKHSGAGSIDLYAEADSDGVAVFVRDRGRGFDAADVAQDRRGISHSITDRMARHGGRAEIRSTVGVGTEVRLTLPKEES